MPGNLSHWNKIHSHIKCSLNSPPRNLLCDMIDEIIKNTHRRLTEQAKMQYRVDELVLVIKIQYI